jgi:hypothetical protein
MQTPVFLPSRGEPATKALALLSSRDGAKLLDGSLSESMACSLPPFSDEKEFRRSVFGYGHFLPPANTEHMTTLRCRAAMSFLLNSTLWSFVAGAVLISS